MKTPWRMGTFDIFSLSIALLIAPNGAAIWNCFQIAKRRAIVNSSFLRNWATLLWKLMALHWQGLSK